MSCASCAAGPTRSSVARQGQPGAAASRDTASSRDDAARRSTGASGQPATVWPHGRDVGQDPHPAIDSARQPAHEDRGPGEDLAPLRRPLTPDAGETLRPLRLDHVLHDETRRRRSPGSGRPSSGGARRRQAHRPRRPRRTATGRSRTGSRSARPDRGRPETPSASDGSRRRPSGPPGAAPGPPPASPPRSRPRTGSRRTRRRRCRTPRPRRAVSQTSACTSGTGTPVRSAASRACASIPADRSNATTVGALPAR